MRPSRFLIVPDKFKGCLSASEVAQAIARGIRDAIPSASITSIPLADGGDGTGMILGRTLGAGTIHSHVHDPLGKRIRVAWHLHGTTAFLDFASASGLHLVPPPRRNPVKTSSRGVGELVKTAVERGARKIILGVGGSATVDGGVGAMQALGIRFLDRRGKEIPPGGGGLAALCSVDFSRCALLGKKVKITLLADVTNPLLGPNGAAAVFGPQKGASPAMVRKLEKGLRRLDALIRTSGRSLRHLRSAGAAGGVVAGFMGILGSLPGIQVRVTQGIDFVLDALDISSAMKRADWILTGEGQLDFQTIHGKTIEGVTRMARRMKKPVIAFAGKVKLTPREMKRLGLTASFPIAPGPCTLEESFDNSAAWLRLSVANACRLL